MPRARTRNALAAIVALGLAVRLAIILGSGAHRAPELFEYDEIARNLLAGNGYVYAKHGTPYRSCYSGVPYVGITTFLYATFPPGWLAVLVFQSASAAAGALVVFFIGRELWGSRAGLLAALLAVTHPALLYCDVFKLHPVGFDALATSSGVAGLLWARRSPRPGAPLIAGFAVGAALLQRGSLLLAAAVAPLWLRRFEASGDRSPRLPLLFIAGVLLPLAPWVARSVYWHGKPLMSTTVGEMFWIGNAPGSSGSNLLPSRHPVMDLAPSALVDELGSKDELGQQEVFWRAGLQQ